MRRCDRTRSGERPSALAEPQFTWTGGPAPRSLGPAELKLAAEAFHAGLEALGEGADGVSAHALRHILARLILESAFNGERDPMKLCTGALDRLRALRAGCNAPPAGARSGGVESGSSQTILA